MLSFERVGTAAGGSVVVQDFQESIKCCKYRVKEVVQQNGNKLQYASYHVKLSPFAEKNMFVKNNQISKKERSSQAKSEASPTDEKL